MNFENLLKNTIIIIIILDRVIYWTKEMFENCFKVLPKLFVEAQEDKEFGNELDFLFKEIFDGHLDYEGQVNTW